MKEIIPDNNLKLLHFSLYLMASFVKKIPVSLLPFTYFNLKTKHYHGVTLVQLLERSIMNDKVFANIYYVAVAI